MAPGDTARLYHRLTSYGPAKDWPPEPARHELVLQDFEGNDVATWPPQVKAYERGLPIVELPREWAAPEAPATAVLAGSAARLPPDGAAAPGGDASRPGALTLESLARALFLSAGVVRTSARSHGRTVLFRAAGSAGGRFPMELYVSARGLDGLADGVHWYDPVAHALVRIGPAAGGEATTLVVTGIPWRTGWRYAERGFRHIYWDSGTMLAQTLALTGGRLFTGFPDGPVTRLVGADGVQEWPVALVALEPGAPAIEPGGVAVAGTIDERPVEFPLVTLAQRAGDGETLGSPWPEAPPLNDAPPSRDLDAVILQRGSTRLMDAGATLPRAAFAFSLAAALRGIEVPHFIAVHAVEGVEPGLYRWPDLEIPVRRGDLRHELLVACWDQDLGRDAAYVAMGAIDLAGVTDRGYREAQLAAGIVEGRLHLGAYALGHGASGMTFLDTEIEPLLGEPLGGLLFTCVGVPTYRNTAGGRPGEPVSVLTPTAGETPTS
jgi:hypothetical protein